MSVTFLFNRVANLAVGIPGKEGKEFNGLRINFSVEKTSESNPNQAKIQVFNLSAASRSFVEQKGMTLVLSVGYQPPGEDPLIETLVQGDVKKVSNELRSVDWVTTFEIGDGEIALQTKTFNKSYDKGAKLSTIVSDLTGSLGVSKGAILGIKDKVFKNGVSFSGGIKQVMDNLTKEADVEWSIQDNEVQVLPPRGFLSDEAILISPNSGLINSPVKREEGIEFTSLIVPRLRPGRRVQIQSSSVNGVYRIRKVIFSGDTHEGDWTAKVEAI